MDLADMIFEAQGKKPLFQFGEDIVAWNRPSYWNLNYIKYEIGHKLPVNAGGTSHPENLCYMSARCNQHIQSSLEMHNVLDWYFSHNDEVKNRLKNLDELYLSENWKQKLEEIRKINEYLINKSQEFSWDLSLGMIFIIPKKFCQINFNSLTYIYKMIYS